MKQLLFSLFIATAPVIAFSEIPQMEIEGGYFYQYADSARDHISEHTCLVHVVVTNYELQQEQIPTEIQGSINGVWKAWKLNISNTFTVELEPGMYQWKLFVNPNYVELTGAVPAFKGGHEVWISAHFANKNTYPRRIIQAEKPVIYTYSNDAKEVTIEVQPTGDFSFTYPAYQQGWTGIPHSDGSFSIKSQNYPYLFWEAQLTEDALAVDWNQSVHLRKENTLHFLDSTLSFIGLNDRERTDFITYWAPRIQRYEQTEIVFLQNEAAQVFGQLNCSDASFRIERLYIVFRECHRSDKSFNSSLQLSKLNRNRLFIFEWGGSELKYSPKS